MSSSKVGIQLAGHRYFRGFWLFCTPFRLPTLLCLGPNLLRLIGTHWYVFLCNVSTLLGLTRSTYCVVIFMRVVLH